ncbi:stage II sporulation protein M, partial [Candidatus Pacearchaeota archaeon]
SLSYISNSRRFIYAGIYIFVASAVVGFAASPLLTFLDDFIRRIALKVAGLNTLELILFIFKNNLSSALMSIVLGAFLGIVPIMSAITNGVLVGYVLARALVIAGVASWWRLLPHGIFELPAIFIAIGLGMKLGFSIFEQDMSEAFKERFVNGLKTFVFIILPLLLIAAIIEGSLIKLL